MNIKLLLFFILATVPFLFADDNNVNAVEREATYFLKKNTVTDTTGPSSLQYYDFKENMPNEITLEIYKNRDMSNLSGKNIFVGYGTVDPNGKDCKVFTPDVTGHDNNITVCLPWWRVEREYAINQDVGKKGTDFMSFISTMQRPRPPKNVYVCNAWQPSQQFPGGTVTCATYFDKTIDEDCFNNPKQGKCKKTTCGTWVEENCHRDGRSIGHENEALRSVKLTGIGSPQLYESRVELVTEQFICPGGSFTNFANCTDEAVVTMHPYECKPDDPDTPLDDSIMKYCDENRPVRDVATGEITGFIGTCPAEASSSGQAFQVTCKINSFRQTRNECVEFGESIENTTFDITEEAYDLKYKVYTANVLSGAVDIFSAREECVRSNTIDESREDITYIIAKGSGYLDDDIYLTVHSNDDTHNVVYCNQQHNLNKGSKLNSPEFGPPVQCVPNDGHYSFNQTVVIEKGDVVSVQQATEAEDSGFYGIAGSFAARTHYSSSIVDIDGIQATPATYPPNFPYYPNNGHLMLWENTLGSVAIMFPYVGYYKLYFYNINGNLVAEKDITAEVFDGLTREGRTFEQIFLADQFDIAPALNEEDEETLCLKDDFVDYGGGVYGGKKSKTGEPCQQQSGGSYSKSKAIKQIVVKDMITGAYTMIPLVYPLGYPNRLFVSKLKLYEGREYHCYEEPTISAPY